MVVNLDPYRKQNSYIHVPIEAIWARWRAEAYQVHDLLSDARYTWYGRRNYVELDPEIQPAHIFRVRRQGVNDEFA